MSDFDDFGWSLSDDNYDDDYYGNDASEELIDFDVSPYDKDRNGVDDFYENQEDLDANGVPDLLEWKEAAERDLRDQKIADENFIDDERIRKENTHLRELSNGLQSDKSAPEDFAGFSPSYISITDDDEPEPRIRRTLDPVPIRKHNISDVPNYEDYKNDDEPYLTSSDDDDDDYDDGYDDDSLLVRLRTFLNDFSRGAILKKSLIIFFVLFYISTFLFQSFSVGFISSGMNEGAGRSFNPVTILLSESSPVIFAALLLSSLGAGLFWYHFSYKRGGGNKIYSLSPNGTYGTARLASDIDLEGSVLFGNRNRPEGLPLGVSESNRSVSNRVAPGANKNMAVFGASGSGKSYSFVKPSILSCIDHRFSYFVTDPSGELYRDTAVLAGKAGFNVRVLNLKDFSASSGWNPFAILRDASTNDLQTEVDILVSTILSNTTKEGERGDAFFDKAELNLLKALILYVALTPEPFFKGEPHERHLGTVYDLLSKLAGQEGALSELSTLPDTDPAKAPWNIFQAAGRIKPNVILGLASRLQILQNNMLKEVFSHDEIDLSLPGKEPCAYYIISSVNHDTFRFVLSLFFSCAFEQLITDAERSPNTRLDNHVYFLFDEFKSIGSINGFSNKLANVRKYDIAVAIIFQDPSQIEAVYPRQMKSILSNCDTWLVLGVNDEDTSKMISNRSGETTIVNISYSERHAKHSLFGMAPEQNVSTSDGKRMILTPNEVIKMKKYDVLVICRGKDIYKCTAYGWTNHYFAEFIAAKENKTHYEQYIPEWQNHQKTMDKRRSFQSLDSSWSVKASGFETALNNAVPNKATQTEEEPQIKKQYAVFNTEAESQNLIVLE